jgi:hypothetical protein
MEVDSEVKPQKGIKDFGSYDHNIFRPVGIEHTWRTTREKDGVWHNPETGEVVELVRAAKTDEVVIDTLTFVKLYADGIRSANSLSIPAYRLLNYIMLNLKPNIDWITIDIDDFLDSCGYASSVNKNNQRNKLHYYRAVSELLRNEYLCKRAAQAHSFFINVNRFFNGDRRKLK